MTPGAFPLVSVIVPVRDGAGPLALLLDSLERQRLDRRDFEVIVVDNGSADGTAEIARSRGATVVSAPIPNRARARNAGARTARAELLVFTDADCIAEPAWLEGIVKCLGRHDMAAGPVRLVTSPEPSAVERYERLWRFGQERSVGLGWAASANLGVRRAVHHAIGGFDTTYRHIGEDVDYCLRARAAGFELAYCDQAPVGHPAERRWGPMLRRTFFHGYSVNQLWRRHGVGYRAWRAPLPALSRAAALGGLAPEGGALGTSEAAVIGRVARAAYVARMLGSAWAEVSRAR